MQDARRSSIWKPPGLAPTAIRQTWMTLLFDCAGVRQLFRLQSVQNLFTEQPFELWNRTLGQVCNECQFQRHRAGNDARAIQLAFQRSAQLANAC